MTRLEEIAATEPNIDDTEYLLDLVRRLREAGEESVQRGCRECDLRGDICLGCAELRAVIAEAKA